MNSIDFRQYLDELDTMTPSMALQIILACEYLERQGEQFAVDYGFGDAVEQAFHLLDLDGAACPF